ncbi:YdbC family protein [Rossellomorea aquimaris]|uniref:YdbC family protein n=1 Tax=Rossellomorea aquimaris TaxID=189382 RepID=UPI001CD69F8C|nr:YdbC family protein [Rossellomorea aquimaris]MCA1058878.1 YdbC family protein [Rossellomorea aquimaris]
MLIKRINCKVNDDQRDAFSEYQQQWGRLSSVKGFMGQLGGWSNKQPNVACVYAFWETRKAYEIFMEEVHDMIFSTFGQGSTYSSIDVDVFDEVGSVLKTVNEMRAVIMQSQCVRISLVDLKGNKKEHFILQQEQIWNPGMAATAGMVGGTYAFSLKDKNHFLVLTGWKDEVYHRYYVDRRFPDLYRSANPSEDVIRISADEFKVENAWRVLKDL